VVQGSNSTNVYVVNRDGTGTTQLTHFAPGSQTAAVDPVWSRDGAKIVYGQQDPSALGPDLVVMNADGSGPTRLTNTPDVHEDEPDWQPIPINAYPRPRGATPMRISLVPAYPACTSRDRTHGAPLAYRSCSHPQLTSQYLTVGTPDANGKRTTMEASILLRVVAGASPDVRIDSRINNVFNKDLTDYTGSLRANLPLQITDKDN
jgi:hypothetical protein